MTDGVNQLIMKYFISYAYRTKSGTELFGNDVKIIEYEITSELIQSLEKEYESLLDARQGKLKILYIIKL